MDVNTMLMRTDSFRDLDQLTRQFFGGTPGTWSKPTVMPMDAYRVGDDFVVHFDLTGIALEPLDLQIERNVLTVRAERRPVDLGEDVQMVASERPLGVFARQLFLGDALDAERICAHYDAGVPTLRIPVAEKSKPRKIAISAPAGRQEITT
jgi:HSP20 family protein